MPTASPATSERRTPEGAPVESFERDFGDYIVNFVTFHPDMDQTPLLKGLPDDRCQCPHWGYVLEGSLTYHVPLRRSRRDRPCRRGLLSPAGPRARRRRARQRHRAIQPDR